MSSVKKLAEEIRCGLLAALPNLRKVLNKNLPMVIAAVLEARTANTALIATYLPLETERDDLRQQRLRRILSNKFLIASEIMAPFAQRILREEAQHGQILQFSMDQTDIGDQFAVLMLSVRIGDRALPLTWMVESGTANIGFAGQQMLLNQVVSWLPANARVMLSADRFYPSEALFTWLKAHNWQYRLRLKTNFLADLGVGDATTTGALAKGQSARYLTNVALFASGVMTNIGILQESGHKEPWIIAMDCPPTRARVLDYASRWCIEPMFSDFKSRGFGLEDTHLEDPNRLSALLLIMSLAMYWCVTVGRLDAETTPTYAEKKPSNKRLQAIGLCAKPIDLHFRGFSAVYVSC